MSGELPRPKKQKRKKAKLGSTKSASKLGSPKSSSSASAKHLRSAKPMTAHNDREVTQAIQA